MSCKKSLVSVWIGLAAVMIFASLFCVPAFASPTSPKANWIKYMGASNTYWEYWDSDTPFYIDPITQEIKNSSSLSKYYTSNNGQTWTAGGSVWSGFGSNNPSVDGVWNSAGTLFKFSSYSTVIHNTDLLNRKDNTVYQKGTDSLINNYYIQDNAGIFDKSSDELVLLEMEKKWEKNAHIQFFIYTYTDDFTDGEEWNIFHYGQQHQPSGWGSCTVFIQKKSNNDMRIGFATSARFSGHIKFSYNPEYVYAEFYKVYSDTSQVNSYNTIQSLGQIYQYAMYGHGNSIAYAPLLHPLTSLMQTDSCIDSPTDNYTLLNDKITGSNNPDLTLLTLSTAESLYLKWGCSDEYRIPGQTYLPDWSGYASPLIFFWSVKYGSSYIPPESQQPPASGQGPLPPAPASGEKSPFTIESGGVNPGAGLGGLKFEGFGGKLSGKIPSTHFLQSFSKMNLSQADYKTMRPTIAINLHSIANTTKNISGYESTLPNNDSLVFDFQKLETIKYFGVPVLDYFRGLITAFMIFYTAVYVWKKLVSLFSGGE